MYVLLHLLSLLSTVTLAQNNYLKIQKTYFKDKITQFNQDCINYAKERGQIYLADFNGDHKIDLLCHFPTDGEIRIGYYHQKKDGDFDYKTIVDGYDMYGVKFCGTPTEQTGSVPRTQKLHIADVNGDEKADLICEEGNYIYIYPADINGMFSSNNNNPYFKFQQLENWCENGKTFVADFNGDRKADLLCHMKIDNSYSYNTKQPSKQTKLGFSNLLNYNFLLARLAGPIQEVNTKQTIFFEKSMLNSGNDDEKMFDFDNSVSYHNVECINELFVAYNLPPEKVRLLTWQERETLRLSNGPMGGEDQIFERDGK